jgi:ribose 5-phosphate isomerase A
MDAGHSELKRAAALRAIEYVGDGMTVGLGTGSTAEFALRALAQRVSSGLRIVGVPTSEKTAALARDLGVPLTTLEVRPEIDVTIDGADEVILPSLDVIKGRGGALLREKIVALASREVILIVDDSKIVRRLGEHDPVPVEVIPFGWGRVCRELAALDCEPKLRERTGGDPYVTDSGNYLLDCHFETINDPAGLAARIKAITGVVEHGLFISVATRVIVAHPEGIQVFDR